MPLPYRPPSQGSEGYVGIATSWLPGQTTIAAPASAPTATPSGTGGTIPAGTYTYEVTFVTANGETTPGPATGNQVLSGTTSSVALSAIPTGASGTTARKIYRNVGGGTFGLVQTLNDNTTTTWTDTGATAGVAPPAANTTAPDPYAFTAATQFLLAENITLASNPNMIIHEAYVNSRDPDIGYRTGKYKTGGQLTVPLYISNGHMLLVDSLGIEVSVSAVTSDTTTSITTDASGTQSILVLSGGTGTYSQGQIVLVDTGTAQEPAPVISWTAGTKTLVLPLLKNTHTSNGTTVSAPAQKLARELLPADGFGTNLLPFVSVEENIGGNYSWQYRAGQVGKLDIKASAAKIECTVDVQFIKDRQLANGVSPNPSPTAFNTGDSSLTDLSMEFIDGFLVFPLDQQATGTAVLGYADLGQDWSISINNTLKDEACFDRSKSFKIYPTVRVIELDFKYLNTSNRPVAWTDYLVQNLNAPFQAFMGQNYGTSSVPRWEVLSFVAPNTRYQSATEGRAIKDMQTEQVKARALSVAGAPKLSVYSLAQ